MIRLLAFLEADHVTGPAKNLLEFHRQLTAAADPPLALELAVFQRALAENELTRSLQQAGVTFHRILEPRPFDPRTLVKLRRLVAAVRPDIVQTHSIKSHFLLWLSGTARLRPWIAFHHGYTSTRKRLKLYNQLDRFSLPHAAHVVAVSQAFAGDLRNRGVPGHRLSVLHNAIDPAWGERARDPDLRRHTRTRLGIGNEKIILIVGRLSREKSHVLLVRAMTRLRDSVPGPPPRLLIVGDGPERPAIEQAAHQAGCSEQILWAGFSAEVLPYYAAADVAVLASKTEGSPNALLEAMAARVPVVATAVGGVPEIVTHGQTALLVPPEDQVALARALARVLTDEPFAEALATCAHTLILDRYTPQQRMHTLCGLYAGLTAPSLT